MKVTLFVLSALIYVTYGLPENVHLRSKRDITCSLKGTTLCSWSCKGRGWKTGECIWDTESGSYDCVCETERRGIRCNVGGDRGCHYSCVVMGYREGSCDENYDTCNCSGGNSRWGNIIEDVRGRF